MLGGYAVIANKIALINKTQMNLFQINFFVILIDELKTSLVVIVIMKTTFLFIFCLHLSSYSFLTAFASL